MAGFQLATHGRFWVSTEVGTLDEAFETATLIQTGKIEAFPIVAMGLEYWQGLRDFLRDPLLRRGTIDAADLERIHVTDSVADAMAHIRTADARREAERLVTPRPSRVLREVGRPPRA